MSLAGVLGQARLPKIPEDGLQCYLDASLYQSWPRTGSTWFDISGKNRHFTWSSVSFTDFGQLSYFNTSGRVATGPASNSFSIPNGNYTIIYVAYTNSFTSNGAFKFHRDGGDAVQRRAIFAHPTWTSGDLYFDQGGCCDASQRVNVSITGQTAQYRMWTLRRGSDGRKIIRGTTTMATNTTAAANITMNGTAAQLNPNDEGYNWDGRLLSFAAYNRAISDAEVTRIYNFWQTRGLGN